MSDDQWFFYNSPTSKRESRQNQSKYRVVTAQQWVAGDLAFGPESSLVCPSAKGRVYGTLSGTPNQVLEPLTLGRSSPESAMNSSFALINSLVNFLGPLSAEWFVSGGWAIDIHLNQVTRERCDLDISVPFSDRLKCIEFFLGEGWRIEGKLGGGFRTLRRSES